MRRWVAERLEQGRWRSPLAGFLSDVWEANARVVRPLHLPPQAGIIGICGATLGGSGVSRLVLEVARQLSTTPARVAVAAHGYRGRLRRVQRVLPTDRPDRVGDEAAWLSRELHESGVPVFAGPARGDTVAAAARDHRCVIVDSLLQTRPRPIALSLLALDHRAPWGAGRCPPSGDLRATPRDLLRATDLVVTNGMLEARTADAVEAATGSPAYVLSWSSGGARSADGQCIDWHELAQKHLGVVLAIARPERVLSSLAERGLGIAQVVVLGDHDSIREPRTFRQGPSVAAWLTTGKCATKLGPRYRGAPVWVLDYQVQLPLELTDRVVRALAAFGNGSG